jgi:predicted PhzF superfamily epimerase YddE/YHI9
MTDKTVVKQPITWVQKGQWLIGAGLAPAHYVARQGTAMGRAGRVHVQLDEQGQVWVGGESVVCIQGHVTI